MDQNIIQQAADAADRAAPAPSLTDIMPRGAARLAGKPASPVNAASMRFLQAIQHALGDDLPDEDAAFFVLYCRVCGGTPEGRADLWRRGREPLKLWDAYLEWMCATGADEFAEMVTAHAPDWLEVSAAQQIIGTGDGGGSEGNVTGSQSS